MTLFLNGTWKVTHRPYQADIQDILAENFVPEGWLNANVPEEIHATLRRAGARTKNAGSRKRTGSTAKNSLFPLRKNQKAPPCSLRDWIPSAKFT